MKSAEEGKFKCERPGGGLGWKKQRDTPHDRYRYQDGIERLRAYGDHGMRLRSSITRRLVLVCGGCVVGIALGSPPAKVIVGWLIALILFVVLDWATVRVGRD